LQVALPTGPSWWLGYYVVFLVFFGTVSQRLCGQIIDSTVDPRITTNDTVNAFIKTTHGFDVEMQRPFLINRRGRKVKNGYNTYYLHIVRVEFKQFRVKYKWKDTLRVAHLRYDLQDSAIITAQDTVVLSPKEKRENLRKSRQDSIRKSWERQDSIFKAEQAARQAHREAIRQQKNPNAKPKPKPRPTSPAAADSAQTDSASQNKPKVEVKVSRRKAKRLSRKQQQAQQDSAEKKAGLQFGLFAVSSMDRVIPRMDTMQRGRALMVIGLIDNAPQMVKYLKRRLVKAINRRDSLQQLAQTPLPAAPVPDSTQKAGKPRKNVLAIEAWQDAREEVKDLEKDLKFFTEIQKKSGKKARLVKYFLSRYFLEKNLKYNISATPYGLPYIRYDERKFGPYTFWMRLKDQLGRLAFWKRKRIEQQQY
jgi:hypothetical protein